MTRLPKVQLLNFTLKSRFCSFVLAISAFSHNKHTFAQLASNPETPRTMLKIPSEVIVNQVERDDASTAPLGMLASKCCEDLLGATSRWGYSSCRILVQQFLQRVWNRHVMPVQRNSLPHTQIPASLVLLSHSRTLQKTPHT